MFKKIIIATVFLLPVLFFGFSINVKAQGMVENEAHLAALLSSLQEQLNKLSLQARELLRGSSAGSSNRNFSGVIYSFSPFESKSLINFSILASWSFGSSRSIAIYSLLMINK